MSLGAVAPRSRCRYRRREERAAEGLLPLTLLALLDAGLDRRREEQHGLLHPAQNRALSERCALGESAFFFGQKQKNTLICICVSVRMRWACF